MIYTRDVDIYKRTVLCINLCPCICTYTIVYIKYNQLQKYTQKQIQREIVGRASIVYTEGSSENEQN